MNVKLDGVFTMLAPLSHIGQSIGPDSYLNTVTIIDPAGKPGEVFCYTGNAWRGQLRDMGAKYLLNKLGARLPLDLFYLLFSGGAIGGTQSIDIDQGKRYRQVLPFFSIFGGGVGNQILPGKMNIGPSYPMGKEVQHLLPEELRNPNAPSWRTWTTEQSFTRKDDAKDDNLTVFLQTDRDRAVITGDLFAGEQPKKEKKEAPQQMRYTQELLAAGSRLYHRITLKDFTELELGAWVSCLTQFAEAPYIGGQGRKGDGLCTVEYEMTADGKKEHFITVGPETAQLSSGATEAKKSYDQFLQDMYDNYLIENKQDLVKLMEAGAA
jgi:hypothetical protein